jgi:hypothetical protein
LGGRDWKDHGLNPIQAKVQETPISTIKVELGGSCLSSQVFRKYKKEDGGPGHSGNEHKTKFFKVKQKGDMDHMVGTCLASARS